ncbi:rRNA pseudouridine synthase [Candidatus Nomurabacteria bacterium]|nr:rRNA pseudouridine synthase [Candidatus Nomurabacteria bacterium]
MHQTGERLNKYLALQLGISRREADEMIRKGLVTVNGVKASLGSRILPTDTVCADGAQVSHGTKYEYILLNKPVGYVCSRRPQGESPTVYSLLPAELHSLKLVGRLDKDSSGIILLTNNGEFSHKMTHPSFSKTKIYEVGLTKPLQPLHRQMISDYGVMLEDGKSQFTVERIDADDELNWRVVMKEGRNRQIRRTFAALGYKVKLLHRTNFGNYALGDITSGQYIKLNISPNA